MVEPVKLLLKGTKLRCIRETGHFTIGHVYTLAEDQVDTRWVRVYDNDGDDLERRLYYFSVSRVEVTIDGANLLTSVDGTVLNINTFINTNTRYSTQHSTFYNLDNSEILSFDKDTTKILLEKMNNFSEGGIR